MTRHHARLALFITTLSATTFLQGCFPLGLLGLAGSWGIVKTTETVTEVGDATTNLINNTSQQITLTSESIRQTLASIDTLVQHITADADALTGQTVESMQTLTDELARQLRGLEELRVTIQETIAQGGQDVGDTLANVDALIASTKASLDAVTTLLSLTSSTVGRLGKASARAVIPSEDEIQAAARAYLATRGPKEPGQDVAGESAGTGPGAAADDDAPATKTSETDEPASGAEEMPAFEEEGAAPDRS